jgi:hypothetical protein
VRAARGRGVYSAVRKSLQGGAEAVTAQTCFACSASELDKLLQKCPICFKWICESCSTHAFGRHFCSKKCSDNFFFGDDEDE